MTNFIPRTAVGLLPAKPNNARFRNVDRITGHYGGSDPLLRTEADLFRVLRNVQYNDVVNKGYSDIMYNMALNPFRPVPIELRGLTVRGAANGTTVSNTVSPSVLGVFGPNLSGIAHIPNWQENLIGSARVVDDLIEWNFGKQLPWVGHKDWKPTGCPGDWLYGLIHSAFDERPLPPPVEQPFVPAEDLAARPIVGFNHLERDDANNGYVRWVQNFLNHTAPEGCPVDGIWGWISHDRLTKFQGYFQAQGFPCRINGMTDLNTWATIHYIATVEGIS